MHYKNLLTGLSVCLLILISPSMAKVKINDNLNLDAEFRPRLEMDNRDFNSDTGYDSYTSYRTRLGLELHGLIENTRLYLMIGDSRTMGFADPYLTGSNIGPNQFDNNLGVIKAFIETDDLLWQGNYLRVGRMDNDQGRGYIFGPGNWNFYGPRVYDGIKIGHAGDKYRFNLWHFYGAKGDRHWTEDGNIKSDHTLTGVDVTLPGDMVQLLAFLDLDQNAVTDSVNEETNPAVSRWTAALYAHHSWDQPLPVWFDLDAAYQFGSMGHGAGNAEISAWMLAADVGLKLEKRYQSWIGLGLYALSGDDGSDPDEVKYFYTNYCSKHRVLGHMDFFKSDTGTKSRGIQDIILRGGLKPSGKIKAAIDLHYLRVSEAFASAVDGEDANTLGYEIDTTIDIALRKGLSLQMGNDVFIPAEEWLGEEADLSFFHYLVLSAKL